MARIPELAFNLYRLDKKRVVREIRAYYAATSDVNPLLDQLPDVMAVVNRSGERLYNAIPIALIYLELFSPWAHDERYQRYRHDLYMWLIDRTPVRFRIGGRVGARVKPLRLP